MVSVEVLVKTGHMIILFFGYLFMGDLLRREEPLYKDSMTLPPVLFTVSASYSNSMINICTTYNTMMNK